MEYLYFSIKIKKNIEIELISIKSIPLELSCIDGYNESGDK
jgi:hypothetical protein